MHVLNVVLSFLFKEIYWIATLLVGLVTFNLVQLWMKVRELPPGPFPIPIIGNILSFWSEKPLRDILVDFKRRYGGIYTIWVAQRPFVVVSEWKLVKQGLIENRNDIASKPDFRSFGHCQREFMAIVNDKYDRKWAVTRKVAASAVRKFADAEKMATIVRNETDKLLDKALKFKGQPYDPSDDLQMMSINVSSQTAFGAKSLSPAENEKLMWIFSVIQNLAGNMPGDLAYWLLVLFYKRDLKVQNMAKTFRHFLQGKYDANKKTFKRGEIRNYSDAVVTSGIEAEEDDNEAMEYLDDFNMMKIIGALFLAATESTATSLRWMLLHMANYPECQRKMRAEVDEYIGHRNPSQADKQNCPYIWAFISESLRFRTTVPYGVPHEAGRDTQLGSFKIPKGTSVIFHAQAVHMDPEIFPEPETFKPERFLNPDGSFNHDRTGFLAFGEGKRMCLGEKMARNNIFLVLTRLVQQSRIRLDDPPGSADLEPVDHTVTICVPKLYKIIVEKREIKE